MQQTLRQRFDRCFYRKPCGDGPGARRGWVVVVVEGGGGGRSATCPRLRCIRAIWHPRAGAGAGACWCSCPSPQQPAAAVACLRARTHTPTATATAPAAPAPARQPASPPVESSKAPAQHHCQPVATAPRPAARPPGCATNDERRAWGAGSVAVTVARPAANQRAVGAGGLLGLCFGVHPPALAPTTRIERA